MGFQQGLSGLNASAKNLDVIGNNIANANTVGAKTSRAEFADIYSNAVGGVAAAGTGVALAAVSQQFSQGTITTTSNPLDLAISGKGFFQVTDGNGPMYTRNGQFKVDRDGYVVNGQGNKLMGYPADATGTVQPGVATPLRLPAAGAPPTATSRVKLEMNLDARSLITKPAAAPAIDFADAATYNNATSLTAYDAKGQEVVLTSYFQKTAADTWDVYVTANGKPISTDGAGNATASTTLVFPANGGAPTSPPGPVTLAVPAQSNPNGTGTLAIPDIQLSMATASQYGAPFGVTDLSQNGFASGQLAGIQFENNGLAMARYTNGQSRPIGQLEIATFRNPQGLQPIGGNTWSLTRAAGDPVTGVPGAGSLGQIQAGALEDSNVDLTAELVNMITAQRSYQANAQTIKTQDQVLQTIINLR